MQVEHPVSKKRQLVPLLLLVVLAATALAVPMLVKPSNNASAAEIRTAFVACAPGYSAENPVVNDKDRLCMVDVMYSYFAAGANNELWEAIRVQEQDTPYFYFACHTILHKVGERAYKEFEDMASLILDNNSDVCGTAFVMGGLDAFGADSPSPEEFKRVADACSAMDGPGFAVRLRGMCEHSMGHVAWKSTKDVDKAAERCALVESDAGQLACGHGVVMQIYQPVNDDPSRPLEVGFDELDSLCGSWPDLANTRLGCYDGAGYIYTRPLYLYDTKIRRENGSSTELKPEQRQELRKLVIFAVDKCKAHTWDKGADKCLFRASWSIPESVYWDPTLTTEVCAGFGPYKDQCLVGEAPF